MTLNADVGSANANSYVTIAEADSYFSLAYQNTLWAAATEGIKASLLISASRTLDQYIEWNGVKASQAQAMEWPRNSTLMDPATIPKRVKDAVYELAYNILSKNGLSFEPQTLDSVKIGPITVDFTAKSVDMGIPQFIENMVYNLGSPILTNGYSPLMARLSRV